MAPGRRGEEEEALLRDLQTFHRDVESEEVFVCREIQRRASELAGNGP